MRIRQVKRRKKPSSSTRMERLTRSTWVLKERRTRSIPQPFRFTVVTAGVPSHTAWVALARRAEELGSATLVVPDRTIIGFAPLTALAVAAEATTSLRIGSRVFCNDYRHPALLAKEVATLDVLSDGRFELGLGSGHGITSNWAFPLRMRAPA